MVQIVGLGNGGQTAAIPLYQKGFNWIKFWIGMAFACCLCLLLAAAITFLILYILTQTGVIKQQFNTVTQGRLIGRLEDGKWVQGTKPNIGGFSLLISDSDLSHLNENNNNNLIDSHKINPVSKYDKFKSKYVNFRYA